MRKIFQSVPDVPQAIANRAIDIIERHLTSNGVRRAEELSEEGKVRLMREIRHFLQSELPELHQRDGEWCYERHARRGTGLVGSIVSWFQRALRREGAEP